jgi:hypothetical protein
MGVASPVFMNAINTIGVQITERVNHTQSVNVNFEASSSTHSPTMTETASTKGAR